MNVCLFLDGYVDSSMNVYLFLDGYFDSSMNICYCDVCHKLRSDEMYHCKGDPPKEFALPSSWCKFSFK